MKYEKKRVPKIPSRWTRHFYALPPLGNWISIGRRAWSFRRIICRSDFRRHGDIRFPFLFHPFFSHIFFFGGKLVSQLFQSPLFLCTKFERPANAVTAAKLCETNRFVIRKEHRLSFWNKFLLTIVLEFIFLYLRNYLFYYVKIF